MELSDDARSWVQKSEALLPYADEDGIVCIPPVRGEASAEDQLLRLLIPIVASLLLYFVLSPIVGWPVSKGLHRAVAAVVLVSVLLGALYQLSEPGARWLRDAPTSVAELRTKQRSRPDALTDVRDASEAVEDAVADLTGSDEESEDAAPEVQIREPGTLESVLGRLPVIIASGLVRSILTLFMLIYGDRFLRGIVIVARGRNFSARRRIVVIVRQVERDIARSGRSR